MDKYLKKFEDLISEGDPTVRTWFLVRNNYLPIVLSGLYILISTVVGPAFMKNRKPYDLRKTMIVFNLFIVAVYGVCFIAFLLNLPNAEIKYFCKGYVVRKGHYSYRFAELSWVFYLVKYVEFLDTIFFVLRKKRNQISFLHVLHHSVLPVLCWLTIRTETAGFHLIPLNLNAFIHIIMYSYYGLSAMGPSVSKHLWWKKYITQLQMIQFLLMILLTGVVVPLYGCEMKIFGGFTYLFFVPLFLFLFFKYYKENYHKRKTSKENKMNSQSMDKTKNDLDRFSTHKNGLKIEHKMK